VDEWGLGPRRQILREQVVAVEMEEKARSQAPAPALASVVAGAVAAEVEDNTVPVVDIQYYTPSACSMAVR
jgi:hypothetical protein